MDNGGLCVMTHLVTLMRVLPVNSWASQVPVEAPSQPVPDARE